MTAPSPGRAVRRDVVVDAVRTASILPVLAVHLASAGVLASSSHAFEIFFRNGTYGVTAFFVASGFIITRGLVAPGAAPLHRRELRDFYRRRVARLAPLAVVVLAAGAVAVAVAPAGPPRDFVLRAPGATFDLSLWLSFPGLLFNWRRIVEGPPAYGFGLHWDIFWSLAIECQFYLAWPVVLRRARTGASRWAVVAAMVAVGPSWRLLAAHWSDGLLLSMTATPGALDSLGLGAFAAMASLRRTPPPLVRLVLGAAGAAVATAVYVTTDLTTSHDRVLGPFGLAAGVALLVLAGAGATTASRTAAAAVWPGQISYGMYLLHPAMIYLLWDVVPKGHPWLAFGMLLAATVAAASVTRVALETPAGRWLRRSRRARPEGRRRAAAEASEADAPHR